MVGSTLLRRAPFCHIVGVVPNLMAISLVNEFTVVLPQRYRARVVKVIPHAERSMLLLIQDFVKSQAEDPDPEAPLEPVWRLYRYDPPSSVAIEVCVFTQPPGSMLHDVHMGRAEDGAHLLFHSQLLRVDVEQRTVDGVCRLQLPTDENGVSQVRGFAIRRDVACLTLDVGPDQLTLHWIPLDDRPSIGRRFSGGRGERLAFGPSGDLYVLDLLDIHHYRNGTLLLVRDLTPLFEEWYRSPIELLAVSSDGRVFAGCGNRLVGLAEDLSTVLGAYELPTQPNDVMSGGDPDELLVTTLDDVAGTLLIQTIRV